MASLHLDSALILPIRLVYVQVPRRASSEFACILVEGNGFELRLLIDVGRLEDMVRRIEDDQRIARDVGL